MTILSKYAKMNRIFQKVSKKKVQSPNKGLKGFKQIESNLNIFSLLLENLATQKLRFLLRKGVFEGILAIWKWIIYLKNSGNGEVFHQSILYEVCFLPKIFQRCICSFKSIDELTNKKLSMEHEFKSNIFPEISLDICRPVKNAVDWGKQWSFIRYWVFKRNFSWKFQFEMKKEGDDLIGGKNFRVFVWCKILLHSCFGQVYNGGEGETSRRKRKIGREKKWSVVFLCQLLVKI